MVLQDYKIEGDYIKINRKELEEWRDHYGGIVIRELYEDDPWRNGFYLGKRDVCVDILKMFEQLEG